MRRPAWRRISCACGMAMVACALPAEAEFYDLNGRYECLATPDKVCDDATPSAGATPADEPAPNDPAAAAPTSPTAPPKAGKPGSKAAVAKPDDDAVQAIANRLLQRKPESGDLATLVEHAKSGNAKALEMLAWCSYVGVGMQRDPVRAYFLYGRAAAAGAPSGRENQKMVFKKALSPAQRQQVLEVENGLRPAPP